MTAGRRKFAAILIILLIAVAAVFAVTSRIDKPANAVSDTVAETEYFDILKPEGLENKKQFAVSEDKEYLTDNPLLFRLVPKNGRTYSAVSYKDGDSGEKLVSEKDGSGNFSIKLRYNEVYTFYLTEDGEEKTVEVDLANRNIFDLTAPVVDFSKTKFTYVSGGADMVVYINDDVSSRRHITAKSGIKRVTVTAKNRTDPIFEKNDYREGTGTANDGFNIVLPDVSYSMGDITAEIEDHAGHIANIAVAVWSDTVKSNARDMMSRSKTVFEKEVGGIGLNDKIKNRLTAAMDRLNALLNDESSSSLQIREATTSLGNIKEQAENAFKTESGKAFASVDETLILRVYGNEYLYGEDVYLSNQKTTDYYGAARFGDEVIVVLTIKQGTAGTYAADNGIDAADFDMFVEYDIRLTVNGEEKIAEKPFFITVSKTTQYGSPVLYAPYGGSFSVAECQSSDGWIRFEVRGNGVYTAFLKAPEVLPWWAWLLIGIAAAVVIVFAVVATVRTVKKVRAKKLTD